MKITRVHPKHGRYYLVEDLEERNPRTGRPKQKWLPLTRVDEGEAALHDAIAQLKGRRAKTGGDMKDAIAEFLKTKLPDLTPDVRKEYDRMFDVIGDALVDFNVEQVDPGDVLEFLTRFSATPTARRAYKARLSTFFSWAVLTRRCAVNPCREIKLKAPPKRKSHMNPATFWAIHAKLPANGQCFLELCFLTTARPTEIRLLRESQIYDGFIHFQPTKTEDTSGATVDWPITAEIQSVLDRARAINRINAVFGGDAFIIQERGGGPYTKNGLHSMWADARDKAGCPGVTTRDIRPFSLTEAEKAGYTLEDLRKAAAHTTTTTTEGYLDQYRAVVNPLRMTLPAKPQPKKT